MSTSTKSTSSPVFRRKNSWRTEKAKPTSCLGNRRGLGIGQRLFLFGDHFGLLGHFGVEFDVAFPIARYVIFVEDGLDGAFGHAGFAIDAFIRMDVEHVCAFVKAFDGADHYAIGVSAAHARLSHNVSHGSEQLSSLKFQDKQ